MSLDDDPEVLAVMRSVALYLQRNPLASDTAEGIRRWWLGELEATPLTVERALDALVSRGLLSQQTAADGHRRYRLNSDLDSNAQALTAMLGANGSGAH